MKTKSNIFIAFLFFLTNITLFGQSGMTIQGGGAVTVNGNLIINNLHPCPGTPIITDSRDGKVYTTVLIGSQCWMAQNLNVGTRINGEFIRHQIQSNNGILEKYCYNDDENNCNTYGGLYQWDEAMQYFSTEGVQGICPTGWHLPTDSEWTTLTTYLGGEDIAGGKMKEADTTHWNSPNTGATNSSGFTAFPGGVCDNIGFFVNLGYSCYWRSSTMENEFYGWIRHLSYNSNGIDRSGADWYDGVAVRCLRD